MSESSSARKSQAASPGYPDTSWPIRLAESRQSWHEGRCEQLTLDLVNSMRGRAGSVTKLQRQEVLTTGCHCTFLIQEKAWIVEEACFEWHTGKTFPELTVWQSRGMLHMYGGK